MSDVSGKNAKAQSGKPGIDTVFAIQSAILAAFLMVYVIGLLWLTDLGLASVLPGYTFSGNFGFGLIIFYVSISAFIHWTRWLGKSGWRFYVLGSLIIFFPLVFLSSSLTLFFNPENALVQLFSNQLCVTEDSTPICGRAFAAIILAMSLRALPAVITTPALTWYLLTHHTSFNQADKT